MEMNERDGADVERCGATDESVDWGPAICYKNAGHIGQHASYTPQPGVGYSWGEIDD